MECSKSSAQGKFIVAKAYSEKENSQVNGLTGVSFNFMAAITICSDFGAPKNKV